MKICFCTPKSNFRIFKKEFIFYKDFPNNFLDENVTKDLPFIGFIKALSSDFKFFENISSNDLNYYDYIFYVSYNDEIPNLILENSKIFIYVPSEPEYVNCYGIGLKILNTYLPSKYDCFMDEIFFHPYVYDLDYFKNFRKDFKKNKIFRQRRSPNINISGFEIMSENFGNTSYFNYFEELSNCKYSYSLCESNSPGQTIADSSIVNVLTFGHPNKIMSQKCLPDFCLVTSIEEIKNKINELENNNFLYNSLIDEMSNKVFNNLSLKSFNDKFTSYINK